MSAELKLVEYISSNSDNIRRDQFTEPRNAIVVPSLNEEKRLPNCLASINSNMCSLKSPTQVVVVDNGSTDATPDIAKEFGAKLITEKQKGVGIARQTGLEYLPKSVVDVFTTDADCIVGSHCISYHFQALDSKNIVGTYGLTDEFLDQDVKLCTRTMFEVFNFFAKSVREYKISNGVILSMGYNTAYKREAAVAVGGYKMRFVGEDIDLMVRLKEVGIIEYIPQSVVRASARRRVSDGLLSLIMSRIFFNIKTGFRAQIEIDSGEIDRKDIR